MVGSITGVLQLRFQWDAFIGYRPDVLGIQRPEDGINPDFYRNYQARTSNLSVVAAASIPKRAGLVMQAPTRGNHSLGRNRFAAKI